MSRKVIIHKSIISTNQMPENQNIEYKTSWHAENLKTICAFANSNGGKLYIGKDDNGNTVGINDSRTLMVDYPVALETILVLQ